MRRRRHSAPDVLLGCLKFGDTLRHLFLLARELLKLLLRGGKLLLLGRKLFEAAAHDRQVLRHCLKLLSQFGR